MLSPVDAMAPRIDRLPVAVRLKVQVCHGDHGCRVKKLPKDFDVSLVQNPYLVASFVGMLRQAAWSGLDDHGKFTADQLLSKASDSIKGAVAECFPPAGLQQKKQRLPPATWQLMACRVWRPNTQLRDVAGRKRDEGDAVVKEKCWLRRGQREQC